MGNVNSSSFGATDRGGEDNESENEDQNGITERYNMDRLRAMASPSMKFNNLLLNKSISAHHNIIYIKKGITETTFEKLCQSLHFFIINEDWSENDYTFVLYCDNDTLNKIEAKRKEYEKITLDRYYKMLFFKRTEDNNNDGFILLSNINIYVDATVRFKRSSNPAKNEVSKLPSLCCLNSPPRKNTIYDLIMKDTELNYFVSNVKNNILYIPISSLLIEYALDGFVYRSLCSPAACSLAKGNLDDEYVITVNLFFNNNLDEITKIANSIRLLKNERNTMFVIICFDNKNIDSQCDYVLHCMKYASNRTSNNCYQMSSWNYMFMSNHALTVYPNYTFGWREHNFTCSYRRELSASKNASLVIDLPSHPNDSTKTQAAYRLQNYTSVQMLNQTVIDVSGLNCSSTKAFRLFPNGTPPLTQNSSNIETIVLLINKPSFDSDWMLIQLLSHLNDLTLKNIVILARISNFTDISIVSKALEPLNANTKIYPKNKNQIDNLLVLSTKNATSLPDLKIDESNNANGIFCIEITKHSNLDRNISVFGNKEYERLIVSMYGNVIAPDKYPLEDNVTDIGTVIVNKNGGNKATYNLSEIAPRERVSFQTGLPIEKYIFDEAMLKSSVLRLDHRSNHTLSKIASLPAYGLKGRLLLFMRQVTKARVESLFDIWSQKIGAFANKNLIVILLSDIDIKSFVEEQPRLKKILEKGDIEIQSQEVRDEGNRERYKYLLCLYGKTHIVSSYHSNTFVFAEKEKVSNNISVSIYYNGNEPLVDLSLKTINNTYAASDLVVPVLPLPIDENSKTDMLNLSSKITPVDKEYVLIADANSKLIGLDNSKTKIFGNKDILLFKMQFEHKTATLNPTFKENLYKNSGTGTAIVYMRDIENLTNVQTVANAYIEKIATNLGKDQLILLFSSQGEVDSQLFNAISLSYGTRGYTLKKYNMLRNRQTIYAFYPQSIDSKIAIHIDNETRLVLDLSYPKLTYCLYDGDMKSWLAINKDNVPDYMISLRSVSSTGGGEPIYTNFEYNYRVYNNLLLFTEYENTIVAIYEDPSEMLLHTYIDNKITSTDHLIASLTIEDKWKSSFLARILNNIALSKTFKKIVTFGEIETTRSTKSLLATDQVKPITVFLKIEKDSFYFVDYLDNFSKYLNNTLTKGAYSPWIVNYNHKYNFYIISNNFQRLSDVQLELVKPSLTISFHNNIPEEFYDLDRMYTGSASESRRISINPSTCELLTSSYVGPNENIDNSHYFGGVTLHESSLRLAIYSKWSVSLSPEDVPSIPPNLPMRNINIDSEMCSGIWLYNEFKLNQLWSIVKIVRSKFRSTIVMSWDENDFVIEVCQFLKDVCLRKGMSLNIISNRSKKMCILTDDRVRGQLISNDIPDSYAFSLTYNENYMGKTTKIDNIRFIVMKTVKTRKIKNNLLGIIMNNEFNEHNNVIFNEDVELLKKESLKAKLFDLNSFIPKLSMIVIYRTISSFIDTLSPYKDKTVLLMLLYVNNSKNSVPIYNLINTLCDDDSRKMLLVVSNNSPEIKRSQKTTNLISSCAITNPYLRYNIVETDKTKFTVQGWKTSNDKNVEINNWKVYDMPERVEIAKNEVIYLNFTTNSTWFEAEKSTRPDILCYADEKVQYSTSEYLKYKGLINLKQENDNPSAVVSLLLLEPTLKYTNLYPN